MLKTKDEALAYLKKIKTRAEVENGSKVKALRTGRGGNSIPVYSQYSVMSQGSSTTNYSILTPAKWSSWASKSNCGGDG
jgi:hypothetical protein